MTKRIIMRIEITAGARDRYRDITEMFGLKEVMKTSRLIEWFSRQDEQIQLSVLGLHPTEDKSELSAAILKRIVREPKSL